MLIGPREASLQNLIFELNLSVALFKVCGLTSQSDLSLPFKLLLLKMHFFCFLGICSFSAAFEAVEGCDLRRSRSVWP